MSIYSTGTIHSATPSTALMTALDSEFTSNGWTFIETYTNGTNVTNVYKSPAGSNSAGTDFYIGVNRTSTTSTVALQLGELYNSTTHLWRKYAPASNAAVTPDAADYTYIDAVGILPNSAVLFRGTSAILTTSTSPFKWYSNMTINRVIVGTSVGGCTYGGLYDSLIPGDTLPLCVTAISTGTASAANTTVGASTREPLQTATSASNWMCYLSTAATSLVYGNAQRLTNQAYARGLYSAELQVSKVMFVSGRNTTTGVRGLLKDVVYILGGATFPGETVSFVRSSVTYNYIKAYTGTTINAVLMPMQ